MLEDTPVEEFLKLCRGDAAAVAARWALARELCPCVLHQLVFEKNRKGVALVVGVAHVMRGVVTVKLQGSSRGGGGLFEV